MTPVAMNSSMKNNPIALALNAMIVNIAKCIYVINTTRNGIFFVVMNNI
jgi:hypothetical protein